MRVSFGGSLLRVFLLLSVTLGRVAPIVFGSPADRDKREALLSRGAGTTDALLSRGAGTTDSVFLSRGAAGTTDALLSRGAGTTDSVAARSPPARSQRLEAKGADCSEQRTSSLQQCTLTCDGSEEVRCAAHPTTRSLLLKQPFPKQPFLKLACLHAFSHSSETLCCLLPVVLSLSSEVVGRMIMVAAML